MLVIPMMYIILGLSIEEKGIQERRKSLETFLKEGLVAFFELKFTLIKYNCKGILTNSVKLL